MNNYRSYYSNWRDEKLSCPACGWRGEAEGGGFRYFRELLDVTCPECDEDVILLIVPYPTREETEIGAKAGIPEAVAQLRIL